MNRDQFIAELRRMADNNGIYLLKENQLLQVMDADIASEADFINILPSFSEKNTYLLVNTRSVTAARTGMFNYKICWSVAVGEINDARPIRSAFSTHVKDIVRIDAQSGTVEFTFGFFNPNYDGHKAEIAQSNAEVAVHEINLAMKAQGLPDTTPKRPADAQFDEALDIAARLHRFTCSLALLTGQNNIGQPFGQGLGLENAMSLLPRNFAEPDKIRQAGEMMAMNLIGTTGQGRITPEDVHYVMGTSNITAGNLTADQAKAAESLAGAALTFLSQFPDKHGANIFELWKKRDDVAGEFLCWHAVAWGRLATVGRIDPIDT